MTQTWAEANVIPFWESPTAAAGPAKDQGPCHWAWRAMEPLVARALDSKGLDVAERRVLSLVDPAPRIPGFRSTIENLNAGLQVIAPGEVARPHRHSMNAIRFVLAGEGATTIVNGQACPMQVGDLVLTPGWCWHEHVHDGVAPIVWLDVLDVQLHRYLGTDEFEPGPVPASLDDRAARSGALTGAKFLYPLVDALAALNALPREGDGSRLARYINPETGGPAMPPLDCYLLELAANSETVRFRTTAHAVCAVVSGQGQTRVNDADVAWEERDIFSLPSRQWITHKAVGGPAYVFVCSDREILRRLDLLDEEWGER